jgi:hypothetical protein
MMQMTLESQLQATRPPVILTAAQETRSIHIQSDLVDVSETAQDAGIPYKIAVSSELYERMQHCSPNDPYENEVVLWNVLSLAAFERTLNALVPAFAFSAIVPCANGGNETIRLRYVVGDPVVIGIAH